VSRESAFRAAPNTVTAQFTAFSAVFASVADVTSSTGATTLQSVLDSAHTGALVTNGVTVLPVTLTADQQALTTLNTTTLSWSATGAASCTATGGATGDGWAGNKRTSGSATVANTSGGQITYAINCSGPGLKGSASATVDWIYTPPSVSIQGQGPISIGGPVYLTWSSNVSPCIASGGVAGDGWAGSKTIDSNQTVTASQLGNVTYVLTCGTSPNSASAQVTVSVVPVSVSIGANATRVRIGSSIYLNWTSGGAGDSCAAVGGSPTDGWASNIYLGSSSMSIITETVAGSYTYGIQCTSGGQTANSSVNVVWTNDAPAVAITAVSPTQTVYPQLPAANPSVDLQWSSNVAPCTIAVSGPFGTSKLVYAQTGVYPAGTASDEEAIAGVYTYTLQCDAAQYQASTTITWTNSSPQITLTAPTTTWVANYPYSLFWTTDTTPCTQTGGSPGDGWAGSYQAGQASETVTETAAGSYTFTLTCGTGISQGQATLTVTVPPAAASISATPSSVPVDQVTRLTWNSTVSPCTSVSPTGVNWGGSDVAPSGSIPVIETASVTYTYTITCGSGNQTVQASTKVTVEAPPPTTISANVMSAVVDTPVTLSRNSAAPLCTATGGDGNDGWPGTKNGSGTATVSAAAVGAITYGVSCGNDYAMTQVAYTAPTTSGSATPTPAVTLTSNMSSQVVAQKVTLSWSAKNSAGCTATGGDAGDGWSGSLALSGSMKVSEPSAGTRTYGITCTGAPPAAIAMATVSFTNAASSSSGSSSSGGGGGSLGSLSLMLLAVAVAGRLRRLHRSVT
jgi:large repetitive protein